MAVLVVALFFLATVARPSAAQDFPVTVVHSLGETVVSARPRRVVSLGLNDHDFLYALGVAPVGVSEWWGGKPFATWPWAEDERRALGAEPAVSSGRTINLEWVLAREPDLIVATYRDLDRKTYERLSRIAPVIAAPAGYPMWEASWQEQLRLIDRAVSGNTAKADAIVASLDAKTAEIRQRYPKFEDRTATLADFREGQFVMWGKGTPLVRFLGSLGFAFPKELDAMAGNDGWIRLSLEHAAMLDLDVVIWPNGKRDLIETMPTFRDLRLYREARSVWFGSEDDALAAALWFQSPLSVDYVLDRLPPLIAPVVAPEARGKQ